MSLPRFQSVRSDRCDSIIQKNNSAVPVGVTETESSAAAPQRLKRSEREINAVIWFRYCCSAIIEGCSRLQHQLPFLFPLNGTGGASVPWKSNSLQLPPVSCSIAFCNFPLCILLVEWVHLLVFFRVESVPAKCICRRCSIPKWHPLRKTMVPRNNNNTC